MLPSPRADRNSAVPIDSQEAASAIVFSDLDGTLLDAKTYRFDEALPALEALRTQGIPLVLCSSKTRAEMEIYRRRFSNRDPFIYENGGGIFIPFGMLPSTLEGEISNGGRVIRLGTPYSPLRGVLVALRRELGIAVKGFGDLTALDVAKLTGLPLMEADLARRREFDEPFRFENPDDPRAGEFLHAIVARGLHWTRGRFYHILGDNDKGRAVRFLTKIYRRERQVLTTIGLGDAANDLPLLEAVDIPVLVQREDRSYVDGVRSPRLVLADGVGPVGWNRAILGMFGK